MFLLTSSYLHISSLWERDQRQILERMTGKFKHWWSSTPPISTKRTITSHLNWTQTDHDIWRKKSRPIAWGRYRHLAGLNLLIRSQHSPLDYWISNDNTYRTYWLAFIYL